MIPEQNQPWRYGHLDFGAGVPPVIGIGPRGSRKRGFLRNPVATRPSPLPDGVKNRADAVLKSQKTHTNVSRKSDIRTLDGRAGVSPANERLMHAGGTPALHS